MSQQIDQIHEGMKVTGSQGKQLGKVDRVIRHPHTGAVQGFVVSHGILGRKHKELTIDLVRQVNVDPDLVVVRMTRSEFKQLPDLVPTA